jgi:hypothetical protein
VTADADAASVDASRNRSHCIREDSAWASAERFERSDILTSSHIAASGGIDRRPAAGDRRGERGHGVNSLEIV